MYNKYLYFYPDINDNADVYSVLFM